MPVGRGGLRAARARIGVGHGNDQVVAFGERAVLPYLVAIDTMPKVAFAPIFLAWLGFGISSKVALAAFRQEAKKQHVRLIWATYRIAGNVVEKATNFNRQLRAAVKKDPTLVLFDWNKISGNKPSWFSGDKVHLSRGGAVQLARQLSKFLKSTLDSPVAG